MSYATSLCVAERARRDDEVRDRIRTIVTGHEEVYGPRKMWRKLLREERRVARCTVVRGRADLPGAPDRPVDVQGSIPASASLSVLCLTARADVSDRVRGLDAGADDYLRKPFALAELQARIRALARRGGQGPRSLLEAGDLRVDFAARRLYRGGLETPMTAREWALLEILAAREGKVVARVEILELIWRDATPSTSASLDVIVGRVRRKLGEDPQGYAIRTVRGEGYSLVRRS